MQMEVIHRLAALRAVVDNEAEAVVELLLARDLGGRDHEMAENLLVAGVGLGELREAVAHLGDEDDVHGCLRRDVAECEHRVVLEDDSGGDLLVDDLVEDGGRARIQGGGGVERGVLLGRHGYRGRSRGGRRLQVRAHQRQATRQRGQGQQQARRRERQGGGSSGAEGAHSTRSILSLTPLRPPPPGFRVWGDQWSILGTGKSCSSTTPKLASAK